MDSRVTSDAVRRRRLCQSCRRRFTTYERAAAAHLKVVKRDEHVEPFDLNKLIAVLRRVCRDRPMIDEDTILRIARSIEAQFVDAGVRSVRSSEIAALALARLADIDKLAYDRLAADYMDDKGRLRLEGRTLSPEEAAQLDLFGSGSGSDDD